MAISDKLQELIDIKQDIKVAIENKGVDMTGVDFGGYAEKIDEIPSPKEEQEVTVDGLIFSSGDVVVTPSTGKVMAKVTVVKDNDLVPENIVKDVNIFGVVGTAETGGEGGGGVAVAVAYAVMGFKTTTTTSNLSWTCSSGLYNTQIFIDEEGNFYTPTQVKIYHNQTYKTYANVTSYLFGTATNTGTVTFKATHPVSGLSVPVGIIIAALFYDEFGTGLSVGLSASVGFTSYQGLGHYSAEQIYPSVYTQTIPAAWFDTFIDMTDGYVSNYNEIYDGNSSGSGIHISFYDPD